MEIPLPIFFIKSIISILGKRISMELVPARIDGL